MERVNPGNHFTCGFDQKTVQNASALRDCADRKRPRQQQELRSLDDYLEI